MTETTLATKAPTPRSDTACVPRFDPADLDCSPHAVERQVRRVLSTQPGLNVSGLVVHRLPDGVCLTGIVETLDEETDVCGLVRKMTGVNQVINRLLVRSSGTS